MEGSELLAAVALACNLDLAEVVASDFCENHQFTKSIPTGEHRRSSWQELARGLGLGVSQRHQ
jgi:hypothetical protein